MPTSAAQAPRVLVVEDDETLRFTLDHNLRREGYRVLTASRGDDGLRVAREESPDLIVLDVMLPGIDGIQFARILRRDAAVPIIMLTALGAEGDRVAGLDAGADDYLAKPFGMRELLARVRALLRRSSPGALVTEQTEELSSGDIGLDLGRREVRRDGHLLKLKPKEFDLLLFFVRHAGRVFSRDQILAEVWGDDFVGGPRTVDVHVRWLRQKIEAEPSNPERLRTARGAGYLFEG